MKLTQLYRLVSFTTSKFIREIYYKIVKEQDCYVVYQITQDDGLALIAKCVADFPTREQAEECLASLE